METSYTIDLYQDAVEVDDEGRITHHPLNSRYFRVLGQDWGGHLLSFAGSNLDRSPILSNVRVFYLSFHGPYGGAVVREEWADPLRLQVLQRLSEANGTWHLSIIGFAHDPADPTNIVEDNEEMILKLAREAHLDYARIEVTKANPGGYVGPRSFFEAPANILPQVMSLYWPYALPAYPIEGYNLSAGNSDLLRIWSTSIRDDKLFREIIDTVNLAFYTFPAEHRDFVFLTNKLSLEELHDQIDLPSLRRQAMEIGRSRDKP